MTDQRLVDIRVVLRRADGSARVLAVPAPLPPRLTLEGVTHVRGVARAA
jgi:hypothetical protein